jgi:hypothetical protein
MGRAPSTRRKVEGFGEETRRNPSPHAMKMYDEQQKAEIHASAALTP